MRNEKLALLVNALKKQVSPEKFNISVFAVQGNRIVRFSELNPQDFMVGGECGCALAWYKILINPKLEFEDLDKEFGTEFSIVSRFFLGGCIVTALDGNEYPIRICKKETTLYEWINAVEAWLDGGQITHYPSSTGAFRFLEA